jgi:hypothetical protein
VSLVVFCHSGVFKHLHKEVCWETVLLALRK